MKMRVSEIRVKQIRVNQGLGVFIKYLFLPNNLLGNNVNTVIFYDGYW